MSCPLLELLSPSSLDAPDSEARRQRSLTTVASLERFLKSPETQQAHRPYAFDVVLGETEVDGLPTHVNLETICSIDYLRFSCGISQCYAIVNVRLFHLALRSMPSFPRSPTADF